MYKTQQRFSKIGILITDVIRLSDNYVFTDCTFTNGFIYNRETIENGICFYEDLI